MAGLKAMSDAKLTRDQQLAGKGATSLDRGDQ